MPVQGSETPGDHPNPWQATRSSHQLDHIVELPELHSHGSAAVDGQNGSITGAQLVDEPIAKKDDDALAEEGGVYAEVRSRSRSASTVSWFGSVGSRLLGRKSKSLESSLGGSSGEATPRLPEGVRLAAVSPFDDKLNSLLVRIQAKRPRLGRALVWVRGPSPPHIETILPPFPLPYFGPRLARFERWCTARLMPLQRRRHLTTPLFLLAWILAFAFLVRASFFTSSTNFGAPTWVDATSSFWSANDGCGINGTTCQPFTNDSFIFRCPSQVLSTQLLNNRAVGDDLVIYQPLVVGGMDSQSTYRADSWICAAAIHHGLFDERRGGCGEVQMVGEFTGYVGGKRNGVDSIAFESTFPSSYRFVGGVSQNGCRDLRDDIVGFDVAMTFILSFFIRPGPQAFFWILLCIGAWHVILVSDPSAMPPNLETAFKNFLPVLFVGESFWRHAWRWVAPAFENSGFVLERTVWYLAGFWVGLLINVSLNWIPIDRLTPHDINQQPGGLVAVIVLVIFILLVVVNQLRVIRRTGWFFFYLRWYIVGGVVVGILSALPGLEFRLHHYIAAIVLMPGSAFVTRPSAIFQGFLLGMFLDGAMRWGMDSILQTPASLVGDGTTGSPLPDFLTNATNFAAAVSNGYIQWSSIPEDVAGKGYDGFALLVDDVLRQTGAATNYSLAALDANVVHYFRLAYQQGGTSGDFTKAATAFLSNSTWIDPASGPS